MMSNSSQNLPTISDNGNYQSKITQLQADNDEQLIHLWLHGRSKHTLRAYHKDIQQFLDYSQVTITTTRLVDLQEFTEHLFAQKMSLNSVRRTLASVKSLFNFAHRLGYAAFDVGKPLRIPKSKNELSQRILTQEEVFKLIDSIDNIRNRLIVKVLYYVGLRISELACLRWQDISDTPNGAVLTVQGKGNKTNIVLLPTSLHSEMMNYQQAKSNDTFIFSNHQGNHLNPDYIRQMVKRIALKVLGKPVTPHWLRHSHASHALDNGCPIHLVQKQLNHSSIATTGRYLHARPTESSSKYLK